MSRSSGAPAPRRAGTATTAASAMLVAAVAAATAGLDAAWSAPPRFDAAGYAVLARSLLEGRGYRSIDHPESPRHVHFPPGYPLFLAAVWRVTGVSTFAAHLGSLACTTLATVAAWFWFRRMMSPATALTLGLALAVNWLWGRIGGAIQSEPLYLLLGQSAILLAAPARTQTQGNRWAETARAVGLGILLAACILTRHIALALAVAIVIHLALGRHWKQAALVAVVAAFLVAPWIGWLAIVREPNSPSTVTTIHNGSESAKAAAAAAPSGRTQADLIVRGGGIRPESIVERLAFYIQRIPDQLTGPFVEVGTRFQGSRAVAAAANLSAGLATGVIALGWGLGLRQARRRLAGLITACTLGLLLAWPFTEAGRFLLPLIPCILVGAVEGLSAVVRGLGRAGRRAGSRLANTARRVSRSRLIAAGIVLAVSLPYSAYALIAGKVREAETSQRDFDAACAWLATSATRPGPVMARHPGEVFWRTGRPALEVATSERPGDIDANAEAIARTIDAYHVAYLLIDQSRYVGAPPSPLWRFVEQFPARARRVWSRTSGHGDTTVYEVEPSR